MTARDNYSDVVGWRHQIHRQPELGFEVPATASFIEAKLREFGCDEIVSGIGQTGIVGIINGKGGGSRTIGIRTEMDALPIFEESGVPWESETPGKMHACGHDGHAAMVLGAAQALARDRNFSGRVALIFQPAEEKGGGGREMVKDGMMERFSIDAVYGMHNMPGLPVGHFGISAGPIMAETAEFDVKIVGRGGHAAAPHATIDPVVIAAQITLAAQTIASRAIDPLNSIVVSITRFLAGDAYNVIAPEASLRGTIRSLQAEDTKLAKERFQAICEGCASMHGGSAEVTYYEGYPTTCNWDEQTEIARKAAREATGHDDHVVSRRPSMGAEDFAFMLQERPGAMIVIGNGDSAGLHHPKYDFNDEAIPYGINYWLRLIDKELPLTA
ncbi:amidohydrolase [Rhizobium sp. P38BS-XIX]|uniref:M20 aminoacylase family protein n=1 Tax=Rhizobium sp. P38BS-XIX TaxID=2726740 RepID=UPI0014570A4B|nr:M20 aminoacylase family protein [Rhizobium sp. P38BS-XIX]NLR99960.1 amidohydrolase [Rhizobium sp. P38BS-XIX]